MTGEVPQQNLDDAECSRHPMIDQLLKDPRVTVRSNGLPNPNGHAVVYWMQRAQRGRDNPALDIAIALGNELGTPVLVFFGLHPRYPNANERHYNFLIEGLTDLKRDVEIRGASFVFRPYPNHDLIRFCNEVDASIVVGDENPLRKPNAWRKSAAEKLRIPFWTVDADVIVPTKLFSKEEYAARTLRPKMKKLLAVFLQPSNNPRAKRRWPESEPLGDFEINKNALLRDLPLDRSARPVMTYVGGASEGEKLLSRFLHKRLASYDKDRNNPNLGGTSELSAYLHFGQISPIRIALEVLSADAPDAAKSAFLEELIVRRELAINYVAMNPNYDSLSGAPEWARKTLADHSSDVRPHIYSVNQLEFAETHDELWNATQKEMLFTGRMHGYLRMYWAKKILEWSKTPEEAFESAVILNDRYLLDGRDPNGYAGIAWAIGGKHDRPWSRREVFGTIRYMSQAGMTRKFDVKSYIDKIRRLSY